MFEAVKRYFSNNNAHSPEQAKKADAQHILMAACALLLEIASADGEFSEDEQGVILSLLEKRYGLCGDDAAELIKAAQAERGKSIDLWQFTNLINQNYSEDDKIGIMETIWKVIYADGRLNGHEDYLVHNLANLLRLSHAQMIDAKLKAKG
jgi:uncharacterized tellurite resistance protein B-like protein